MLKTQKSKPESTTSEVPKEETYPVYTLSGTLTLTISGNNNVVTILAGQPSPPVKPPGGGNG